MSDEFDDLRPTFAPKELQNWNVEDLQDYIDRLEGEITRVKSALETKTSVADAASQLFKS